MFFTGGSHFKDIVFIDNHRYSQVAPKKRANPLIIILVSVLVTLLLIAVGYFAGFKAGLVSAPGDVCCIGDGKFDFDFDL